MFVGTFTPKLDDKGRLTLPAKFRDSVAGGMMVTKGQDHCLSVYPPAEFEQVLAKIAAKAGDTPKGRAFLRIFSGASDEQRPDAQGRITINPGHREYAGLTKECLVVGAYKHFEIWDKERYEEYLAANEDDYSEVSGIF